MRSGVQWPVVIVSLLCSACSPQRFFYYPNSVLYADPKNQGITYDVHTYPTLNGKKISGIWMKTTEPLIGTVVHFHGNFANVSNHFPLSTFLLKYGYDVFIFDYQGYGASEGRPSPRATVEDGIATLRYVHTRAKAEGKNIYILGHSLGGAAALVAMQKEPLVRAAVIEAAFSSYPKMGAAALRRSVITWPFSWIVPIFLNRSYSPKKYVAEISPRPLFFIHGDADRVVPVSMSQELYKEAKEPKKLWIVPGAGHMEILRREGLAYEKAVVDFFKEHRRHSGESRNPEPTRLGPGLRRGDVIDTKDS